MTAYDLIVIGGGPSGMMMAGRAGEQGVRVLLIEKNRVLGRKLLLTGGGRCNITNAEFDVRRFLEHLKESRDFLYSPFSQFSVADTFSFFERLGLPLVVEEGKRAFPKTQKAADVRDALRRYMEAGDVHVRTDTEAGTVEKKGDAWVVRTADGDTFSAPFLAVATGGLAAPETGSTGDGFRWLAELGHDVQGPDPSLVPLRTNDVRIHSLAGVTLTDAGLSFWQNDRVRIKKKGRVLFTHFGISGPMVLNTAHEVKKLLSEGEVTARIDLFPSFDEGALAKRVLALFEEHKNKEVRNALKDLAEERVLNTVLEKLPPGLAEKKVHSVSKEERMELVRALKNLTFSITGTLGLDKAIVARGGIPLTEMDMRTMRSRAMPDLYVLGDALDINRPSGGFSLQLCWTSGFVAGNDVAARMKENRQGI